MSSFLDTELKHRGRVNLVPVTPSRLEAIVLKKCFILFSGLWVVSALGTDWVISDNFSVRPYGCSWVGTMGGLQWYMLLCCPLFVSDVLVLFSQSDCKFSKVRDPPYLILYALPATKLHTFIFWLLLNLYLVEIPFEVLTNNVLEIRIYVEHLCLNAMSKAECWFIHYNYIYAGRKNYYHHSHCGQLRFFFD